MNGWNRWNPKRMESVFSPPFGDNEISTSCCLNRKGYRNLDCENACQQMQFNSDFGECAKPAGTIQERVQVVGPEHFGVVSVNCAKRRSKWMLCDFYGKVIIEPTTVEHNAGALKAMTNLIADKLKGAGITDSIVAVEMTGVYHRPVQRAFRQAGFDTRTVHPFASKHFRDPLHPNT